MVLRAVFKAMSKPIPKQFRLLRPVAPFGSAVSTLGPSTGQRKAPLVGLPQNSPLLFSTGWCFKRNALGQSQPLGLW